MIDSGYIYNEKQLLYTENVDQVEDNFAFYSISTEVGLLESYSDSDNLSPYIFLNLINTRRINISKFIS